jgi:hypothetical protein
LLLLRGKMSAGGKPLLRGTWRARREHNGRGEQACADKADTRQTDLIGHGKPSLFRLIVAQLRSLNDS